MKKILSILLTLVFAMSMMTGCSAEENTAENFVLTMQIGNPVMTVNGTEKPIDESGTAPVIVNDRTLLPVRAVVEEMGGTVAWDGDTQTVTLNYDSDEIKLVIDSLTATLNGTQQTLDTAPTIINDRTMLPIRFIAESFKFNVDWAQETQTVTIIKSASVPIATTAPTTSNSNKTLVVYYSATGSTERVANYIKETTSADIFELEPVKPYTDADLNYGNNSSRVVDEHENADKQNVELKTTTVPNWESYDTVFIGYPIWWHSASWVVYNFVKDNDFTGKTVIPFSTSASSGEVGADIIKDMTSTGNWSEGKGFRSGVAENDVTEWAKSVVSVSDSASTENGGKTLIAYFSMPDNVDDSTVTINGQVLGNNQYFAQVIQEATGADIFRIEPETPYPTDHETLVDLALEEQESNSRPAIKDTIDNFDDYDTIFVGYPIWWSDMPMLMYTFFDTYDFSGKTLIPFGTHGGSGWAGTPAIIAELEPKAQMTEGLSISRNHIQDARQEIIDWVNSLK